MKPTAKRLLKPALFLAVAYVAVLALLFVLQTWLIFPTYMVAEHAARLPAAAVELEIATPDGEMLRGLHLPPAEIQEGERLVILGFGGNAWHAGSLAGYLHALYPAAEVVAFHYRGYAPSATPSCRPNARWRCARPSPRRYSTGPSRARTKIISLGAPTSAKPCERRWRPWCEAKK